MANWQEMTIDELQEARAEMRRQIDELRRQFREAGMVLEAKRSRDKLQEQRDALKVELEEVEARLDAQEVTNG